ASQDGRPAHRPAAPVKAGSQPQLQQPPGLQSASQTAGAAGPDDYRYAECFEDAASAADHRPIHPGWGAGDTVDARRSALDRRPAKASEIPRPMTETPGR